MDAEKAKKIRFYYYCFRVVVIVMFYFLIKYLLY